jgi:hypothetical protein
MQTNITYVPMLSLELDKNTKKEFKKLKGFEDDKQIEKFIKDNFNNINIKEYSYHQVETFIKLFISQFSLFEGKLKFTESNIDITNKCMKYFEESTQYFTNGGFAKLITNKTQPIKDKYDLCLDAYENDLGKVKFKTPLIFIDKDTKKFKLEILPDKSEDKNTKYDAILKKYVDIVYVIDATGSIGYEIKAVKEYVIQIFKELTEKYKDYNIQFCSVFYRDKVYNKKYIDEYFPLTNDIEDLRNKISNIRPYGGGGDGAEDWVGGYELALNKMDWRKGIKLIIHIADDGAHGKEFTKRDKHSEEGIKLTSLIQECAKKNINIIGFKINEEPSQSFETITEIYNNYKMSNMDNGQFIEIYEFVRGNSKAVSETFHKLVIEAANQVINPSYKFLKRLKQVLYLPNDL